MREKPPIAFAFLSISASLLIISILICQIEDSPPYVPEVYVTEKIDVYPESNLFIVTEKNSKGIIRMRQSTLYFLDREEITSDTIVETHRKQYAVMETKDE